MNMEEIVERNAVYQRSIDGNDLFRTQAGDDRATLLRVIAEMQAIIDEASENSIQWSEQYEELKVELRRKTIAHGAHLIEENVQLKRKYEELVSWCNEYAKRNRVFANELREARGGGDGNESYS